MAERHVALIGMMGAGKSTTGREVAARTGRRFVDTDAVVEARTGRTLRELWEEDGEHAYRPLERDAVRDALASDDPVVLATPGGVAVDDAMARAVNAPEVRAILLRASLDTLSRRIGDHPAHRPLLGPEPRRALARLLGERADRYEELADVVVDVDGLTPAGVVAAVLAHLDAGDG